MVNHIKGDTLVYVRAKVAGEPVLLLVDTGAARSFLSEDFAELHELERRRPTHDERVQDANGTVARRSVLADVPLELEGAGQAGTLDFVSTPSESLPPGTVGVLAPQDLLRPGGAFVLDIGRGEFRYEPEDAALKRLKQDGLHLDGVDYHGCLLEGFFARAHRAIDVKVNGVGARMMIDTGAAQTVLASNNPALQSMATARGRRTAVMAANGVASALAVDDVPLSFSGVSFTTPVIIGASEHPCQDGLLGADVLQHCVLVWGWSSLWASCRTPPPEWQLPASFTSPR